MLADYRPDGDRARWLQLSSRTCLSDQSAVVLPIREGGEEEGGANVFASFQPHPLIASDSSGSIHVLSEPEGWRTITITSGARRSRVSTSQVAEVWRCVFNKQDSEQG